jgi:hypothetical protein
MSECTTRKYGTDLGGEPEAAAQQLTGVYRVQVQYLHLQRMALAVGDCTMHTYTRRELGGVQSGGVVGPGGWLLPWATARYTHTQS